MAFIVFGFLELNIAEVSLPFETPKLLSFELHSK